jgi:predicted lactoylglutathione lyase
MQNTPFVISLATADRRAAYDFYRALGLATPGELADDGVPEPLQVEVGGTRIMFVPTGGFGWGLGARPAAPEGTSECILCVSFATAVEVAAFVERAVAAGATIVTPVGDHAWGHVSTFTDPDGHLWMATVGFRD